MGYSDILPLLFSLAAVIVLLYLCYLLSKFLAGKAKNAANSVNIRVLERVTLAPDKGLLIAEVCGACYLMSFSNNGIEILKELDPEKLRHTDSGPKQNFMEIFNAALRGRLDLTGNDRKQKNTRK